MQLLDKVGGGEAAEGVESSKADVERLFQ